MYEKRRSRPKGIARVVRTYNIYVRTARRSTSTGRTINVGALTRRTLICSVDELMSAHPIDLAAKRAHRVVDCTVRPAAEKTPKRCRCRAVRGSNVVALSIRASLLSAFRGGRWRESSPRRAACARRSRRTASHAVLVQLGRALCAGWSVSQSVANVARQRSSQSSLPHTRRRTAGSTA